MSHQNKNGIGKNQLYLCIAYTFKIYIYIYIYFKLYISFIILSFWKNTDFTICKFYKLISRKKDFENEAHVLLENNQTARMSSQKKKGVFLTNEIYFILTHFVGAILKSRLVKPR